MKLIPKNQHWYPSTTKKNVWYPSATAITAFLPKGKFFEQWLAGQESQEEADRILKEAGEKGTRVHDATDKLDRGETINYADSGLFDEEYQLVSFFVDWHKEYKPEVVHIELPMSSDKHKLGGKLDRVYKIDGKMVLWDLKTSKSAIYDSHWCQVSAYAEMYEHLYKVQIDEVAILRVTPRFKKGYEYKTRSRDEWKLDYKQFKNSYETALYLNKGKKLEPKFLEIPEVLSL